MAGYRGDWRYSEKLLQSIEGKRSGSKAVLGAVILGVRMSEWSECGDCTCLCTSEENPESIER